MSMHEPRDTFLGQVAGRPLNMRRNIGEVPLAAWLDQLDRYLKTPEGNKQAQPDTCALQFYLLEHAVGVIRSRVTPYEPLGEYLPVLEAYNRTNMKLATRAFYYLMLITCREMRHAFGKANKQLNELQTLKGIPAKALTPLFNTFSDTTSIPTITSNMRNSCDGVTLYQLTEALSYCFYNGGFPPSYGGPAWGSIADCLKSFVAGETSAAMMLDTIWTLEHNTSSCFNKGMLFKMQSHALTEILDVQRSGQIPQLVCGAYPQKLPSRAWITSEITQQADLCRKILGAPFTGETVDWNAVHALGSIGNYSKYGATAPKKHVSHNKKPANANSLGYGWSKPEIKDPTKVHFAGFSVPKAERASAPK